MQNIHINLYALFVIMENGGVANQKICRDDVISKLKDDGDFDRLRVKIIRKLKENEELRSRIISMVKQSTVINRPGAENMKPRQLSDAIHQEVGDQVMSQISDGVWEIIRSGDGMKSEITETVQSVYRNLLNPKRKENENGESFSHSDAMPVKKRLDDNGSAIATASGGEIGDTLSDSEPIEPPGFSLCQNNHEGPKELIRPPMAHDGGPTEAPKEGPHLSQDVLDPDPVDLISPPGFAAVMEYKQQCDGIEEDPDLPPGFS